MPADKWLSTLRGEKAVTPDGRLTVWFWEHPDDESGFFAEVDGGGLQGRTGAAGGTPARYPFSDEGSEGQRNEPWETLVERLEAHG